MSARPVQSFGQYELGEEIARGGMGVVYRARQKGLDRIVAVKLILAGQFASEEARERFRAEARAAAKLRHPNIVPVHEVGEHHGFLFYSMDYIPGQNLAQSAREKPMGAKQAAECLRQAAEAVEFAHSQGVLHRDLKPSNVLLDESGRPHVTDFGLARTNNGEPIRMPTGEMLGSPYYMPPEQAGGRLKSAGPWSDVYSLGALLYYLVTGRPPFLGDSLEDTLSQVLHKEPVAPRLLVPRIPRDLETICLKCLQKEPRKRYQTARELAQELERFLSGKPILARPVGSAAKLWRWCRREPALASLSGIAALLVATGASLVLWQWRHAEHERGRAEGALETNRQILYLQDMRVGFASLEARELAPLRAALTNQIPLAGKSNLRGFEWRYLWARAFPKGARRLPVRNGVAGASCFSPDGMILSVYYWDNTVRWWSLETEKEIFTITNAASLGTFTSNGDAYVVGTHDGTIYFYDVRRREITRKIEGVGEMVAITPDTTTAVTINAEHRLNVIELPSGTTKFIKPGEVRRRSDFGWGTILALSNDGKTLAVSQQYQAPKAYDTDLTKIELYDLETQRARTGVDRKGEVYSLLFSHDGKTLFTGWGDGAILISDIGGTNVLRPASGKPLPVFALALSADGKTLASGGASETVQLWDLLTGAVKEPFASPCGEAWSLTFSADNRWLVAGGRSTVMTLWDLDHKAVPDTLREELSPEKWGNFCFSSDSKLMAAVCKGGILKVWETATFDLVATFKGIAYVMAFSPDSKKILAADSSKQPLWWNFERKEITTLQSRGVSEVNCADVSEDRKLGILGFRNGRLQLVDIKAGTEIAQWFAHEGGVFSVRFSPGGSQIISGGRDRVIIIWDRGSQRLMARNPGEHRGAVCALACSPNMARIASGCGADMIKLWDPRNLSKALASMPDHKGAIRTLDFSPDAQTLASGSEDHSVRLFSVRMQQEIAAIWMDSTVRLVLFSPDGNTLAIVADDGTLKLLRATTFDQADAEARRLGLN